MELVLAKLPNWLENQIRNLNCQSYEGLCEAIIHYIGNQKPRSEKFVKPLEKENYRANKDTPYHGPATELKRVDTGNPDKPQPYSRDLKTVECFRCGKTGHMKKNCRVKMEQAKCGVQITKKHLPDWTKNVKINGQSMKALLDTGCTKSLVHPKCVQKEDYLGYQIPYQTASNKSTYFPAASVTLELERKNLRIAVGVSEHLAEDMLMGRDIPHFRQYLKKALDAEPGNNKLDTPPTTIMNESDMVVTRAQQLKQDELERKGAPATEARRAHRVCSLPGHWWKWGEESEAETTPPPEGRDGDAESDETVEYLDGVITRTELGHAQKYDSSLTKIRERESKDSEPSFWSNVILMRKTYHTLGKNLIVVPKVAQRKILSMAHNTPIAGHFARDRTLHAIRARMDWPGVAKDVKELCASCPICQKAGPAVTTKAPPPPPPPLHPLPVMKEPFARVAMDVFGPLSRTKTGNKYILVLMDYSTKYM